MTRRMSCSLTVPAVRDRSKTVTRRDADTWVELKPGSRLTLVEKAMGLRKGERQRVLADVEVTDVRVEPLSAMTYDECAAEGFPEMEREEFIAFWLASHGEPADTPPDAVSVRRIEWRYL